MIVETKSNKPAVMERKWLRAVNTLINKFEASKTVYRICRIFSRIPDRSVVQHAMDGVRVNKVNCLTSAMSVRRSLEEFRDYLNDNAKALTLAANEFDKEIKLLVDEWEINWDICPACEGKAGYFINEDQDQISHESLKDGKFTYVKYDWHDCENCNGRGLCEGK